MLPSPESGNRIAYVNPRGQVCIIGPLGDGYSLLTSSRRHRIFQFPSWSPDGTHLAVIGRSQSSSGIFLFPMQSSHVAHDNVARALYISQEERPFYLYWSPNSSAISFLASHPHGMALHLIERDSTEHRLLTIGQPCFWDWSPDGNKMLIHTGGNHPTARLTFVDVLGEQRQGNQKQPGFFQTPVIAASGQCWAFVEEAQDGSTYIVIARHTHAHRILVAHQCAVALGWCPINETLAFMSPSGTGRHFYGALRLIDAHTNTIRTLTEDTVLAFFWSPDGRKIAYLTIAGLDEQSHPVAKNRTNGVYTNGNGHLPKSTFTHLLRQDDPVLNLWVVDVASGQRQQLISFQPSEEFLTQFLPFFDQYALSHRLWSPTSDALVVPNVVNKQVHIVVVPINGDQPHSVAEGCMACWNR